MSTAIQTGAIFEDPETHKRWRISDITQPSIGEGSSLWVYGHSFTQSPGQACTSGLEFFNKIKTRRGFSAVTTYGVGSSRALDVYIDAIGSNDKTPMAGSTWDGTRRGAVIVDAVFNDAFNKTPAANAVANALTANMVKNYQDTITSLLAVLTSSGRVECEAGTKGGTWNANATGAPYSGAAAGFAATDQATLDVAVTVPASGYVWLIMAIVTTLPRARFTVTEGGTTYADVSAASQVADAIYTGRVTAGQRTTFPVPVKITATPGAHTFRITQQGAGNIVPDCFLLPHASPVAIALLTDPLPQTSGSNVSTQQANRDLMVANMPQLNAAMVASAALFPSVSLVDPGLPTPGISTDGVHPNDRGMRQMADAILNAGWLSNDPDSLYAAV